MCTLCIFLVLHMSCIVFPTIVSGLYIQHFCLVRELQGKTPSLTANIANQSIYVVFVISGALFGIYPSTWTWSITPALTCLLQSYRLLSYTKITYADFTKYFNILTMCFRSYSKSDRASLISWLEDIQHYLPLFSTAELYLGHPFSLLDFISFNHGGLESRLGTA